MPRFIVSLLFFVLLPAAAVGQETFDGESVQQQAVPLVVGMPLEQARSAITSRGLRVGRIDRVRSDTAAGIVIGQSPGPRISVAPNSAVNLTVSRGDAVDSTTVPDLTNHTKLGIIPVLLLSRLQAGRTDSVLNEAMRGRVVEQSPAPGTRVPRGTAVDLWFGYATPRVVPNLIGSTPTEAAARLAAIDLRLGQIDTATSADGAGVITRQRPTANTSVAPGTQVGVTVTMPRLIAVPSLIDSTLAAARTILARLDLTLASVDTTRAVGARSVITAQNPLPQTQVARRTPVSVTVAEPPPLVRVPNLIGTTVGQARDSLSRVGLQLARTDSTAAVGGRGRVAQQQPLPGLAVDAGSGVSITVTMPLDTAGPRPPEVTEPDIPDVIPQQPVDTVVPQELTPVLRPLLPDLVGMPRTRAQRVLDSLGVRYTITEARRRASADTVLAQVPAAGTVITATMHATLTVGGRSWLPMVAIVLIALLTGAALVLRARRSRSWPPVKANLHIVPHLDTGTQSIESDTALIRDEVLWTSHTDGGTQDLACDFALIGDEPQ